MLLFILPVFSDALFGAAESFGKILQFSPGVLLRGFALLFSIFILIKHFRKKFIRYLIWPIGTVLFVVPSLLMGAILGHNLTYDLTALSKSLFLPIVSVGLMVQLQRFSSARIALLSSMEISTYLVIFFILVPETLGFGVETYGSHAEGASGFFTAGNDAGVALGVGLHVVAYRLLANRFSVFRAIMFIAGIYSCTLLGTRAALIFVAGVSCVLMYCLLFVSRADPKRNLFKKIGKFLLGASVLVCVFYIALSGFNKQLGNEYQARKFEEIAQGSLPRASLVLTAAIHLGTRAAILNVTGEGSDIFQRGVGEHWPGKYRRQVEVDWMDAFGAYGIGFTLITHLFVIWSIVSCMKAYFCGRDYLFLFLGSGIFLFFAHGAFAGHALYSPAPATIGAGFIALSVVAGIRNKR